MTDYAPVPSSAVNGIVWPALPNARAALAYSVFAQLELSQWWSPEILARRQMVQAAELVRFAARTVPFYRERLAPFATGREPLTPEAWRRIPLLERGDIRSAGAALCTEQPLAGHGNPYYVRTSGSTGEPVRVQWDDVTKCLYTAFSLRNHTWHRRNYMGKLVSIGLQEPDTMEKMKAGGTARWAPYHASGPMHFFHITDSVDAALDWLVREDPDYLMTYPNYLRALIERSDERGIRPERLRDAATYGEVVTAELREHCAQSWGARLIDQYGAEELGAIALQCPEHDHYLVQSEGVLVEILNEYGLPCEPGEAGLVVVTPLHNFSTPMIRYSLGDYAEVGAPCATGRGLPVIERVYGRVRNVLTAPDGGRVWPSVNGCGLDEIAPVRRFQFRQAPDLSITLNLMVERPLTEAEEGQVEAALLHAVGPGFERRYVIVDSIARSPSGKLEDVVSEAIV